ncbi:MAG TPA: hypothetical protein VEW65_07525 [Chryseolinea sp.]|nr:hypothetical protein [Chryseolinea sp.]
MDEIKKFLDKTKDISIGYRDMSFFKSNVLTEEQKGYNVDSANRSLVTGKEGDWREEWIVIGSTELGDPLFVDTSSKELRVMTAMHGEGQWDPSIIAESLAIFSKTLDDLRRLSKKRSNPLELERNPISDKERGSFMYNVRERNKEIDFDYWEMLLESE